jgi:hypothetical protein
MGISASSLAGKNAPGPCASPLAGIRLLAGRRAVGWEGRSGPAYAALIRNLGDLRRVKLPGSTADCKMSGPRAKQHGLSTDAP